MKLSADTRSKWIDGILSAFLFLVIMVALIIVMKPFEALGEWGEWLFTNFDVG